MIKRIKCTVSEEYILGAGVVIGRVGSHDETALELHFCDIWRGLTKTAFWTDASGQESVPVLLLPNMLLSTEDAEVYEASIPATAKMTQGYAKLIIRGAAVEGEIETIAAVAQAEFEVEAGDVPEDYREQLDIEPTAADQIRQGIEEIRESIHDAIQGAPGKDGLTPYIKDGNWWIGETDTGVKAAGTDGKNGVSVVGAALVQTE
jgi:hypothetical protein